MNAHGSENRTELNGHSSGTPKPPVVQASNKECEKVQANTHNHAFQGDLPQRRAKNRPHKPKAIANPMEWVKPL